jgi:hypothetical protein
MTFIPNPFHMFHIITYDDSKDMDIDFGLFEGAAIKLIVERRENDTKYEQFVHKIEEQNPFKFNIIEQKTVLNMDEEEEMLDAESTLGILRKVINSSDVTVDKVELDEYLTGLYTEALYMG